MYWESTGNSYDWESIKNPYVCIGIYRELICIESLKEIIYHWIKVASYSLLIFSYQTEKNLGHVSLIIVTMAINVEYDCQCFGGGGRGLLALFPYQPIDFLFSCNRTGGCFVAFNPDFPFH
jgi:hypothetical protein